MINGSIPSLVVELSKEMLVRNPEQILSAIIEESQNAFPCFQYSHQTGGKDILSSELIVNQHMVGSFLFNNH